MKKKPTLFALLLLLSSPLVSCRHVADLKPGGDASDDEADTEPDTSTEVNCIDDSKELFVGGFEGVDILVMVDNSGSMAEEQVILSTQLFTLVNALVFPTDDWAYPAIPSVRIAIVTSNMGVQYGDTGVASDDIQDMLVGCEGRGDDGKFQTYENRSINIQPGEIRCDVQGEPFQCPTGWTCNNDDANSAEIGHCYPATGDGTEQTCPSLNAIYTETPTEEGPNYNIAIQTACLANLGTDGCGFEQQLQAAAKGLIHPQNNPDPDKTFYRDNYLLAIVVVSDEEDCSIEDGKLFEAEEMDPNKNPHELNIACGENEEFLYTPQHFLDHFRSLKGDDFSTVFAAIVGVPPAANLNEENTCEGNGGEIQGCLDRDEMQNVKVEEMWEGTSMIVYKEACMRTESGVIVTKARPGRRYVELAQMFGDFGYVASICNADWSPAMAGIASLIARQFQGTCYPNQLQWDPAESKSLCNVYVEYENEEQCPFALDSGAAPISDTKTIGGVDHGYLYCPLPKLATALDCAEAQGDIDPESIGWYYCENNSSCRYNVELSSKAHGIVNGRKVVVNCPEDIACE